MKLFWTRYRLHFVHPAGTSRGVMHDRDTWFIRWENDGRRGIGEAGPLWGLSREKKASFEPLVRDFCDTLNTDHAISDEILAASPALQFAWEMAQLDWQTGGLKRLFPNSFTDGQMGLPINGLIWMGPVAFLRKQIAEKIDHGFTVLKLKIGAIDFSSELSVLKAIRSEFGDNIEIRLDANGAFRPAEALERLKSLSDFNIHSIEQPIQPGQWDDMRFLCAHSPVPIALDEELIGITDDALRAKALDYIAPHFIILKPSLLGGFRATEKWIEAARVRNIGWWITSALESNIGLNAIAQWTAQHDNEMTQGLGTGSLYTNNIKSPLKIIGDKLFHGRGQWDDISVSLQWH